MHISLAPVVMVLLAAVLAVILCRHLRIPPMLGYLVVGFIAGPGLLRLIPQTPATDFLGEIGIAFLMFSIGLEFSLGKLKAMRRLVLQLGGLQIMLSMLAIMLILMISGTPLLWAFTVSGALALSSTAIVSRLLAERTELGQQHGQMVMGVLLMQDIAVVPLMILLPALAGGGENLWIGLGLALLKMALTLSLLLVIGNKLMTPWFRLVAKSGSGELFMVNVLLVTLGVAYLTELAGLSLALGAFVAGILISETEYRFQVEDDIRPFRDILLGFFFITVGMKLDFRILLQSGPMILLLFALLLVLKASIVYAIAKRMHHSTTDSLKSALYLAQGGEFGFVLLAIAGNLELVPDALHQAAVAAVLLSMVAAPLLIGASTALTRRLVKSSWDEQSVDLHNILIETMSKNEHVLIIGFGRGGQNVSRVLAQENTPYYALDLDAERVQAARAGGEPVAFGDAKRKEILQAAGLKRARMVLITINNMHESQHILSTIMHLDPTMSVVVRVTNDDYIQSFTNLGADDVVSDTKESSLMLASQALLGMGHPFEQVYQTMQQVRKNRYQTLEGLFVGSNDIPNHDDAAHFNRYAFTLPAGAHLIGKGIHDLPLDKLKLKLLSVRRNTHQLRQFEDNFRFSAQDTLVLLGQREKIIAFENWSLQGDA